MTNSDKLREVGAWQDVIVVVVAKTVCLHGESDLLLGWDHREEAQSCTLLTRFRLPKKMV